MTVVSPIACQRDLFDMPEDVAYLNCAFTAPLLKSAAEAGHKAVATKANPWSITIDHFFRDLEECRKLFGRLIETNPDNVALIPAVSYGISLAAKNLPISRGEEILVLADQFPSNVYPWMRLTWEKNAVLVTVSRPTDSNWSEAVLDRIHEKTAVAALPTCHWTDGTTLDLIQIGQRCREVGAALVVDGTQSLGAVPFSVAEVRPDFLITTSHKWLLGPYSYGYCYVAPERQNGVPLEENWLNREGSRDIARLVDYRECYQPGARRFDVGEASNFILTPIAVAALRQVLDWKPLSIAGTLDGLTGSIAEWAEKSGFKTAPPRFRSPHIIGLQKTGGFPKELPSKLAQQKVFVSVRGDSIRVSPHVYNNLNDLERLFSALDPERI
jgi:selenocysteine lyase/cysteine desulfurase